MTPTFGRPASSSNSSASGIVVIRVSWSRCEAWIGSSPSRTPASSAAAATRRRPSITSRRASASSRPPAGPVRQSTQSGSKRARRCIDAHIDSIRSSTSSGPSTTAFGRIEGTVGTQFVTRRPLDRSAARSVSSSPSFISQIPIPSKPAAAYARTSSSNDAPTVEISLSERITAGRAASRARRTSGRLRQLLRNEIAGAGAEAGAGVRAGADVPEPLDRRRVSRRRGRGAEEQVLVERARPRVDVAADPVRVRCLHVRRRHDDAGDSRAVQVRDVAADPLDDPVGVRLAQLLRPGAVADVDLSGRVALRPRRQLLQLHPDHPGAVRRARGVDGHRLAERDRRLGRKQAAVGLVDGARDAVEAGGEVEERRACEALVAAPARQLVHGDVDLHLAAAVAEAQRPLANPGGCVALAEQTSIELRRRDAGQHGPRCCDRLAVREPDRRRRPLRDDDPLHLGLGAQFAAGIANDRRERVDEARAAALRYRHPAELERAGDHLGHESGHRLVGPEAGVQDPGREQAVRALVGERVVEPVAGGEQRVPGELDEAAPAELLVRLAAEREALPRPELGAEHAEGDVCCGHELVELSLPRLAELCGVDGAVGGEMGARAVRERGRGRQVGVQVLEPEPVEVGLQLGVGGGADPERVPGGKDLVPEARCGEPVDRLDRAAEPVVPLEHADAPAVLREQRSTCERVDPAADEDGVESGHAPTLLA